MKILIVKLSSLGDLIHALPAVNLLRKHLPEAQIDWVCYKSYSAILQNIDSINNVIELKSKTLNDLFKLGSQIRASKYDYVIDLQGLIKTGLLSFASGAKVFGFSSPREKLAASLYSYKLNATATLENKEHIVLQNLDLAKFFLEKVTKRKVVINEIEFFTECESIYLNRGDRRHCEEAEAVRSNPECQQSSGDWIATPSPMARNDTHVDSNYHKVSIIPSTTWESKLWAPEYWVEFINHLKNVYNSEIYILGTMADMPNIEPIVSQLRVPFHLVTNKKLIELPEFFAEMDLVVGVDTGPLHIAAAALYPFKERKKVIGIYGPTRGSRSGPCGFEYISFDEVFGQPASNKKTFAQDGSSMAKLKPSYLIQRL